MSTIRTILCPVRLVRDELEISRTLNRLLERRDPGMDDHGRGAEISPSETDDPAPVRAAPRRPTGAAILLRPCSPSPEPILTQPVDDDNDAAPCESGPNATEHQPDALEEALPALAAGTMPWAVPSADDPPAQRCRWVFVTDASSASLTAIGEEAIPEGSWWQTDLGPLLGTPLHVTVMVQVARRVLEKTHRVTFQIVDQAA